VSSLRDLDVSATGTLGNRSAMNSPFLANSPRGSAAWRRFLRTFGDARG